MVVSVSMPYWGARFQSKVGNRANVWVSYNQRKYYLQ